MATTMTKMVKNGDWLGPPKGGETPKGRGPNDGPPPPPPWDENGEEEEETSDREVPRDAQRRGQTRTREADEIKLLQFPQGSQWRAWRANTLQAITSAAGRQDDLAFYWVRKCETDDPTTLSVPGKEWISLDRKLAAALTNIAHGEIGRQLTLLTTIALNNNQIIRGRVLLATVFKYYASGKSGQVLYDMSHLQSLVMKDNNLEGFHTTWNMVMSELTHVPEPETLLFWYFKQIQHFKPMSEDIALSKGLSGTATLTTPLSGSGGLV